MHVVDLCRDYVKVASGAGAQLTHFSRGGTTTCVFSQAENSDAMIKKFFFCLKGKRHFHAGSKKATGH